MGTGLKCSWNQMADTQLQTGWHGGEGHDLRSDRKSFKNEEDLGVDAGEEQD